MPTKAKLPRDCASCVYYAGTPEAPAGYCRRHGPVPGIDEGEIVFEPIVAADARCGQGAAHQDDQEEGVTPCVACIHWWQPDGQPPAPAFGRRGQTAQWWQDAGYCTRAAPAPSADVHKPNHWKVTHATQGCGDGEKASATAEMDAPPALALID